MRLTFQSQIPRSQGFYTTVVEFPFAYRDLTCDIIFLWAAAKRQGMIGLWGSSRVYGPKTNRAKISPCFCGVLQSFARGRQKTKCVWSCNTRFGRRSDKRADCDWVDALRPNLLSRSPWPHT